ncbi:MAG: glycosyltransferase, partial [Oligoflexia bacterium]|nr:glycosyltransferase [Oligoflexia bacterium]
MTLSIIIPTHKRFFQVQQLLNSIAEQNFPKRDLQVLLISNLKDKRLRKTISHWERVFFDFKYMETGVKGVNKARNLGIRFARGDILYFLDDDCFLDDKEQLNNLMLEHKKEAIGVGGGYKTLEDSYGLEKFYQDNTDQWIKRSALLKNQSEQLVGGNSSYKREVFDKGFYFDPLIVFGGSEEGFNRSLRAQGWTLLFVDKLSVLHKVKLSWLSLIKKSFRQGLGSVESHSGTVKHNLKDKWAFLYKDSHSVYSLFYNLFFKLGFFWGLAKLDQRGILFQVFRFIFLFLKSRWYFFTDYFVKWFYGRVLIRGYMTLLLKPLGGIWRSLGWLYGRVFLRLVGILWYGLGWFYGTVLLFLFHHSPPMKLYYFSKYQYHKRIKPVGLPWYVLGWFYGKVLVRGYVEVFSKPLGFLWYVLGWFYGKVLVRGYVE